MNEPQITDSSVLSPALVADIGGTNARLAYARLQPQPPGGNAAWSLGHVRTLPVAQYPSFEAAAQDYLAQLQTSLGPQYQHPSRAALALATAIAGDPVVLTNAGWSFSRSGLKRALGLGRLTLVNDFEALALALPHLQPHQVTAIEPAGLKAPATSLPMHPQAAAPAPVGNLAVIGPGTGLGVAGLVHTALGWVALPGEGGHATLAPADDFESAVLAAARQRHAHVSAERMLSGIGLPLLHQSVAAVLGRRAPALNAAEIVQTALAGQDSLAGRTVDLFCAWLGSFAGSVALTLGARGGVYIGGGIVPRLGERFMQSSFRARFEAKGRFSGYLQAVPTWLITDGLAALTGAAAALAQERDLG